MSSIKIKLALSPPKKKKKNAYDPEEEAELEKLVFGAPSDIFEHLEEKPKIKVEKNDSLSERVEGHELENGSEDEDKNDLSIKEESVKREPAWVDEEEENYSVKKALREQHRRLPGVRPEKSYNELLEKKFINIVGTPKWADLNKQKVKSEDEDSEEEILKKCRHIKVPKTKKLKQGTIDIKPLHNLNQQTNTEGPFICCAEFHETSMVAFVTGSSGVLSLFEVNGKDNNKLHSMKFDRFSIVNGRFIKDGNEIIVSSLTHSHFFSYNLITGKTRKIKLPHGITNMQVFEVSPNGKLIAIKGRFGEIHVLNSTTYELSFTLKMNNPCNALAFTPDSKHLISHGDCEDMYIWDLYTHRCVNRVTDEGCLANSSIAISPSGQFLATGSKQGVVNIYSFNDVMQSTSPKPLKSVMNLVTAITMLKFNPQSEILAMLSKDAVNAFKMVHLPSFTVFKNFPNFQTAIDKPMSVAFSPGSGFMSITNNRGKAYLYKLKHYGNY